jgi:plastocyanin
MLMKPITLDPVYGVRHRELSDTDFFHTERKVATCEDWISTVGHPSWRIEPTYLHLKAGKTLSVENEGGRDHTFTEVVKYGGGRIGSLNIGLTEAPECVLATGATDPTLMHPGGELELAHLSTGLHTFQCCIHPWMRAAVRVAAERK